LDLGNLRTGKVDFVIYPDNKSFLGSFNAEIKTENGQIGKIIADTVFSYAEKPQLDTFISLKQLPVYEILSILPQDLNSLNSFGLSSKDLVIDSNLVINTDFKNINAQVKEFNLTSKNKLENYLSFSAFYNNLGFTVNDLNLNWDNYILNGYVTSNKEADKYFISTHFDFQNRPYRFEAVYKNNNEFLIQ